MLKTASIAQHGFNVLTPEANLEISCAELTRKHIETFLRDLPKVLQNPGDGTPDTLFF